MGQLYLYQCDKVSTCPCSGSRFLKFRLERLLTPSTAPIFEVRLNQNFVENLPRKNTTITTFHAVSKEGTGLFTDLPNFCHRGCFFFQVIQTFTQMSAEACQEGLFTCKIAKRPGINTRMCLYITYSEPGAQTLQFHARPSPSCFSACSKPQSRWACMHAHNKAFVR